MKSEDLKCVVQMSRALWADPEEADPQTANTVSAVSLLNLTDERELERVAKALLEQSSRTGMSTHTLQALRMGIGRSDNPFFRLFPAERFLLVTLHSGRWSYARLARILEMSTEDIEATAWDVRVKLSGLTPIGAGPSTANCPEYDARHPWTQRFLDDEIQEGRERVFLQNHLMACSSCRRSLSRCRDIYYAVDKVIPRVDDTGADQALIGNLREMLNVSLRIKRPSERSFLESLQVFFRRKDALLALLFLLGLLYFALKSS